MRISEPSPNGVNGLRMLFDEIEQLQPCSANRLASVDAARHVVVDVARQHEQIGRRQHRDRDAGVGELPGDVLLLVRRQARDLGDVAHRDPAAELVLLRQLGDQMQIEARRVVAGVDVHVDVDVVMPRQLEHAVDLRRRGRCRSSARRRSPWRRVSRLFTSALSASGAVDRPSCANAQISRSTAQAYSFCSMRQRLDALSCRPAGRSRRGCGCGWCRA